MPFLDRAIASFLGLALGDAFGRPLEFVRGPSVRERPVAVGPGRFDWTDDTHKALYLAEAVLSQGPDRLEDDAFGEAVGEAFSRWLDDPPTPSMAPGTPALPGLTTGVEQATGGPVACASPMAAER